MLRSRALPADEAGSIVAEDGTHPAGRATLLINYLAAGTPPAEPFWLFWA